MKNKMRFSGTYFVQCYDKDGKFKWSDLLVNGVTTAGLTDALDVLFNSGTQKASWFFGLIDNSGYTAVAATLDRDWETNRTT